MALQTLQRATNYVAMATNAARARRSSDEQVRKKAQRHLVQRMGKLRGLPQKLGQMLSFNEAAESSDTGNAFQQLQEDAEPLPIDELIPVLEQAWGVSWDLVCQAIDPVGKAGSLGQVHRATLRDGRDVAIKIQYPGIAKAVESDLKMLGWLSRPVGGLQRGFDMSGYRQAILDDLQQELDYQQEAQSHVALRQALTSPAVRIPQVVESLSTDKVLVSDWLEGDHWDVVRRDWTTEEKESLARLMLTTFLDGLFLNGTMQADWHPGNFRFRREAGRVELVCYDLGSIFRASDCDRLTLVRLIEATRTGREPPLPLLLALGFAREYLEPMAVKLPALCRVLFEPFCMERPCSLTEWKLKERVTDVLGEDRWNFRIAGPPPLMFLMRAFHGVTHYLRALDVDLFWSRYFSEIAGKLAAELQQLSLPNATRDSPGFATVAKYMKIRVLENGRAKATVTTLASSIEHLDELLDEDLLQRIVRRGIDLDDVVAKVRQRCYAPGAVFELQETDKHVVVTLE